jgi:hypothetical protein
VSQFFSMSKLPGFCRVAPVPLTRGRLHSFEGGPMSLARLATDSIGNFNLTLTNVVVGSAYRVEVQGTGALITQGTAASSSFALTIPAYAAGNPSNDLRIKVRKGTAAPYYKDYTTLATAVVGSQSIYIAQIPD